MRTIANKMKAPFLSSLLNLSGGIFLKTVKPFKKGDFIEINGEIGSVSSCSWSSSEIKTIDGELVKVENSQFILGTLNNLSDKNIIRLELNLNVCYSENMADVKQAIYSFLKEHSGILKSPKSKITVAKLHENHVELKIAPWCLLDHFLELDYKLETALYQHLLKKGFNMPNREELFSTIREIA
ncbi:mechanosensitive ion channel family protein [uncultured Roseivirga sp.]|uniref:mechanosensitive ion channel family protein n=1 Tax=uncultured Roseivirga sp. TaxID=543088 RepID=UPI0030D93931|tara:strand:- start:34004 stop:34555 length:552 start_codon:yes stop_codon:yes gene_type:complete